MDPTQSITYHITDPLQYLEIDITLRQIHGFKVDNSSLEPAKKTKTDGEGKKRSASTSSKGRKGSVVSDSDDDDDDDDVFNSSEMLGQEARDKNTFKKTIKWQEKLFSPLEIAKYSPSQAERDHIKGSEKSPRIKGAKAAVTELLGVVGGVLGKGNGGDNVTIKSYKKQMFSLLENGIDMLDGIEECMIYSYVDRDGFDPSLSLSLSGEGEVDGVERKYANGGRERNCKTMYIACSVDCDIASLKEGAKNKNSNDILGSPRKRHPTFEKDANGKDVPFEADRVAKSSATFYEKVLCTIKMFDNGQMVVTPGFSVEESETSDSRSAPHDSEGTSSIFTSARDLEIKGKLGHKITTFRFTSPDGGIWEYAVENRNKPTSIDTCESLITEESILNVKHTNERRNRSTNYFLGTIPDTLVNKTGFIMYVSIEIVSATNFIDSGQLYCEYDVTLPTDEWRTADSVEGVNWGGFKGEVCDGRGLSGCTMLVSPSYLAAEINKRNDGGDDKDGLKSSLSGNSEGEYMNGGVATFLGILSLALIVLAILLGADTLITALAAVIVLFSVLGSSSSSSNFDDVIKPKHHFNHPLPPLHIAAPLSYFTNPITQSQKPSLLLQLSSKHNFQRHNIEGYGYIKIPTIPGNYEMDVSTWRVKGGLSDELRNFHIGGGGMLKDKKSIELPSPSGSGSVSGFASKFGMTTETSGSVRVRINVICSGRKPIDYFDDNFEGFDENGIPVRMNATANNAYNSSGKSDLGGSGAKNNINEILERVRAARDERMNSSMQGPPRDKFGRGGSMSPARSRSPNRGGGGGGGKDRVRSNRSSFDGNASDGEDDPFGVIRNPTIKDTNSRTSNVLERIRARKEARFASTT